MYIDDDHYYYGAAIIQIAEDESFTAINDYQENDEAVECAYRVNGDIGLHLGYRTKVVQTYKEDKKPVNEYHFAYDDNSLRLLDRMSKRYKKLFLGLVCVPDRQICCLAFAELEELITARRQAKGNVESRYTIHVALPKGREFRVFVNPPREKNKFLEPRIKIAQKAFPTRIFE
jgi:hypothetical protein